MIFKHIDGVSVKAQFAKEGGLLYRYRLVIDLQNQLADGKTACVVMQNPSYASEEIADKSVQFMEKVVFQKKDPPVPPNIHRLIVVNQFARVQTNHFKGLPVDIGKRNDSAIETALREAEIVILAWGCANPYTERQAFVMDMLNNMEHKQVFNTRSHPSRGRYEGFVLPLIA